MEPRPNITIIVQTNSLLIKKSNESHALIINNADFQMTKTSNLYMNTQNTLETTQCEGILGIISMGRNYLLCITSSLPIVSFGIHQLSLIKDTKFIPMHSTTSKPAEDSALIESIKNLLKQGFYYSNTFDLTNNLSAQKAIKEGMNNPNSNYDFIAQANSLFLVNDKLSVPFRNFDIGAEYLASCIHGFIGLIENEFEDKTKFRYILISRRYIKNFGLSYMKRGIDDSGDCADEIETESIILYEKNVFSYLISRGSTPCFFLTESDNLQSIQDVQNKQFELFSQYVTGLIEQYSLVCFICLLDEKKENESKLKAKFESFVVKYKNESIKYLYLNYDPREIGKDAITEFLITNEAYMELFEYFVKLNSGLTTQQCGLFRINCLNGKKSNELEMRIIWKVMESQFALLQIDLSTLFSPIFILNSDVQLNAKYDFTSKYKNLWFENYKCLKNQYAPDLNENLLKITQKSIELLTAKKEALMVYDQKFKQHLYLSEESLTVLFNTWNIGAFDLKSYKIDFSKWLFTAVQEAESDKDYPDILLIGLQEVVELNPQNVLTKNKNSQDILSHWEDQIEVAVRTKCAYKKLTSMNLVGILLFVYVKECLMIKVSNCSKESLKTGLAGTTGNKGSCFVRFNYNHSSLAFCCSHLASGIKNNNSRLEEVNGILNHEFDRTDNNVNVNSNNYSNFNQPKTKFVEHDFWFIFGDLNFRIDTDIKNTLEYISKSDYSNLFTFDQLYKSKVAHLALKCIDEAPLNYSPTYKYIPGTNKYNQKKKRLPSWCDRILFKKCDSIKTISYASFDQPFGFSDHKPVYGLYEVKVFKEDLVAKSKVEEMINEDARLMINSTYRFVKFKPDDY